MKQKQTLNKKIRLVQKTMSKAKRWCMHERIAMQLVSLVAMGIIER